ncbi:hypothetical protein [Pseudonocardia parietis]|uniref:Protein phosphatase 2C-like protein n=1 Tax=Pseudonocardia parietis TaxID=570936 RepID=A0ABS4VX00_9PSEU|nr:hypothetical protein [Pseudonocardia parietis]MBP2368433.1 hypothetical protein [Pseudonocardia parietis]
MQAFVSAFSTTKLGNRSEECEDAYAVSPAVQSDEIINKGPIVVSVADGASESLLSGPWARILSESLTESVVTDPDLTRDSASFADAISIAIDAWDKWLVDYLLKREESDNPIRWYERPKLDRGSHAAALTAQFAEPIGKQGRWSVWALGDVCIFQVRDNSLTQAFPLTSSLEFNNSPLLLGTRDVDFELVSVRSGIAAGTYQSGDQFFIGTDAFSAWFLTLAEKGDTPWNLVRDVTCSPSADEFQSWSHEVRSSGKMRNDDLAIVHVDMG